MGLNYPLFFVGAVITALVLLILKSKSSNTVEAPQLVTVQDAESAAHLIPNITRRINQQAAGTYDPVGSAMSLSSASYSGAI